MLGLLMHTNIIFKNITVLNDIVSCIRTHRCHERETYCFFCIAVIEINPDTLRMFNYFSHLKIKQKWTFQNTRNPNLKLYQLEKHNFIDNISFINPFIHFMSAYPSMLCPKPFKLGISCSFRLSVIQTREAYHTGTGIFKMLRNLCS